MRILLGLAMSFLAAASPAFAADPAPLRPLLTVDDSAGWEAVGRLDISGRGMCTGALIAPDLVLTAAHCLYDRESQRKVEPHEIQFRAGLRHGRASAHRSVRAAIAHPEYVYEPDGRPQVSNDIAVLQLSRPIDNGSIFPFEIAHEPGKGDAVGVVSYAHDRAETPSLQSPCYVLALRFGTLVMSCDVDFGSSGAPVFVNEDGTVRIASVVSAKAEFGERRVSLGTPLHGPLQALLAEVAALPRIKRAERDQVLHVGSRLNQGGMGAKFVKP